MTQYRGTATHFIVSTVVLTGVVLKIEFRDSGESQLWKVTAGDVDRSERSDRIHRAVNIGNDVFEEIVIFFRDRPDAIPQPEIDPGLELPA